MRNAGWYLRQEIIWHKPNPMPESVRDRCTKSHESLFLLTKSSKYYFDSGAIMEPAKYDGRKATAHKGSVKYQGNAAGIPTQTLSKGGRERWPNTLRGYARKDNLTGLSSQHHGNNIITCPARNKRDVWIVPTRPFKGAHFATFPPDLIKPCILSGCPVGGVVLDPFFGAGTTGLVAKQLNRNFLGIDLNAEYVKIAEERLQLNCI
jgi:DNA modification methylase